MGLLLQIWNNSFLDMKITENQNKIIYSEFGYCTPPRKGVNTTKPYFEI